MVEGHNAEGHNGAVEAVLDPQECCCFIEELKKLK